MKSVLVVHAKCGSGHMMAARAVADRLAEAGREAVLYDLLDESIPVRKIYEDGYRNTVTRAPVVWRLMYDLSQWPPVISALGGVHMMLFRRFVRRLLEERPDVVVSTHFFVSQIVSRLKRRGLLDTRLLTVITDFDVHPLWVNPGTDRYIVAHDYTAGRLKRVFGMEDSVIDVWGIPLRREFLSASTMDSLAHKYGKPQGLPTFLVFSSDFGMGPIRTLVERFAGRCGLIVVTGDNPRLKQYLDTVKNAKYLYHRSRIPNIWEPMLLADAVVLKAGGLSVSECAYLKKPMIFMHAMYGQETRNAQLVVDQGAGAWPKTTQELLQTMDALLNDPSLLNKMRESFDTFPHEDSAGKILELI
jgi:processive 1,2-diacylglycerol beta-glucosyltransferase